MGIVARCSSRGFGDGGDDTDRGLCQRSKYSDADVDCDITVLSDHRLTISNPSWYDDGDSNSCAYIAANCD